ncbi:MAG: solute carrier family 23 protein [Methanobacteriaceae archaeon]|jgi:uracil permease
MYIKYRLNDWPKKTEMIFFGLQWLAVTIPSLIIIGNILGIFGSDGSFISYLQKMFLLTGFLILIQVLWGHKLPLIIGPSAVLLVGILTSLDHGHGAINSSIAIGGLILMLLALSGLIKYAERLFTSRVIIVILMLIVFTLIPPIIKLLSSAGTVPLNYNFLFVMLFILAIFTAHTLSRGVLKSLLPLIAMFTGTLAYCIIFKTYNHFNFDLVIFGLPQSFLGPLSIPDTGLVISFLISFLALAINDISSMQSVGFLLKAGKLQKRVKKGVLITGAGNIFAGLLGVVGPVNYSLSPGMIIATQNASRFTLIPAAAGLLILAFSPAALGVLTVIPSPVIGVILLYLMTAQIGAAMMLSVENETFRSIDDGIIVGLPLLLGTVIAFLPLSVRLEIPPIIRSIITNGLVVGVLTVLFLEHVLYHRKFSL